MDCLHTQLLRLSVRVARVDKAEVDGTKCSAMPTADERRAVRSLNFQARHLECQGFTLLEMIFVTALIALLCAMAIPTVFRSKLAANETSAIGTLRVVHTGQLAYSLTCGYGLFAADLPTLGGASGDEYVPVELTGSPTPLKSGYTFALVPGPSGPAGIVDCNGGVTTTEYYLSAVPLTVGSTGNRGFASNHASVIWQDTTGVPPVEPFVAAATVGPIQ